MEFKSEINQNLSSLELNNIQKDLNKSQLNVIKNVLNNRLTLIQGPPGTGKTHTICNIIQSNLKIDGIPLNQRKILCCA